MFKIVIIFIITIIIIPLVSIEILLYCLHTYLDNLVIKHSFEFYLTKITSTCDGPWTCHIAIHF